MTVYDVPLKDIVGVATRLSLPLVPYVIVTSLGAAPSVTTELVPMVSELTAVPV